MKISQVLLLVQFVLAAKVCSAFCPLQTTQRNIQTFRASDITISSGPLSSALHSTSEKIMSEIDIMCIANAADLCNLYDECDIEEREALINRFEEQTDLLAGRMALMKALTNHATDRKRLTEEEILSLKEDILAFVSEKH